MISHRALVVILCIIAIAGALTTRPPPWLVLIGSAALCWWGWLWLCRRHPLIAIAVFGFVRGLLGRQ